MWDLGKQSGGRAALVIGNSRYAVGALKNPKNDAHSISRALEELGFNVEVDFDLDRARMEHAFAEFERLHADVALLYYSGHGVQVDGVNYLVPVGAETITEASSLDLIAVEDWVGRLSHRHKTRLIFFDACRNNPFGNNLIESVGRGSRTSRSATSRPLVSRAGLAEVRANADTFIAFAAAPGKVAYDGEGMHSPFTDGVLKHIRSTDLSISNLMIRTRNEVLASTQQQQEPWDHSALTAPFFFNPSSLVLLMGNAMGLIAFVVSLLPHQFALAGPRAGREQEWWTTVLVGSAIWLVTFILFLVGLQRAYRILRGDREEQRPENVGRPEPRVEPGWRKGLFGGFFGGIVAAPIFAWAYYVVWGLFVDPERAYPPNIEVRPPFSLLLIEITVATVLTGALLGSFSLALAEYFARLDARTRMGGSPSVWMVNRLTGAMLGGFISAIIVVPLLVWHFEPKEWFAPHIGVMLAGGLPGTAIAILSIVNYNLEQFSLRRLIETGVAVLRSLLMVCLISAIPLLVALVIPKSDDLLEWLVRIGLIEFYGDMIGVPHGWPVMIVSLLEAAVVGPLLGAIVGLTLLRTANESRQQNASGAPQS